ncbi:hypothetical protein ACHAWF_008753 [Thalassiosira exigua]
MPITPRYSLTQTSTHVKIEVSIPHVRVSTSTLDLVIVDGTEMHLYAPPTYLLKLSLPGKVVDENAVEESLSVAATTSEARVVEVDEHSSGHDGRSSEKMSSPERRFWSKEDLPKLQYNPEKDHGTLVVTLRKEQEEFWQDLDLLGRLQQPMQQHNEEHISPTKGKGNGPLIQEVTEGEGGNKGHENEMPESKVLEDLLSIKHKRPTYGLFQNFSNVFRDYAREGLAHEMLECPNPDEACELANENDSHSMHQHRREMRLEAEQAKFDPDRYLNDLCVEEEGDMIFDAAISMKPHWTGAGPSSSADKPVVDLTNQLSQLSTSDGQTTFFTSEESHLLSTIQTKNIPTQLTLEQKRSALLTLTDILFAYAYDHRTTDGDPTVESSWTVMILSPSLSWLECYNHPYDTILDVVRMSIRRSLIYPYLRSYSLARKVFEDVAHIINGGRRIIIRCLLHLHEIMKRSECHYLFNKMYIDPLIGWIQQCGESEVQEFGKEIENISAHKEQPTSKVNHVDDVQELDVLDKEHLGLGLIELEKSFFEGYDDEESTSTSEHDESSINYDSDSDSRGVDETTVDTTDEDESSKCNQNG